MIRILHVVSSLGTGSGVASVLMSYYRAIDRSQVQFDFLSFKNRKGSYEKEILSLGGKVYYCSTPSFSKKFKEEMNRFFVEHEGEYRILHCHPIFAPAIFSPYAKKYGITNIISHSHTTKYSDHKISAVRNFLILSLFGRRATHYMACSEKAKSIFYWKKNEDVFLLKNAVDIEKFKFSLEKREEIRQSLNIGENDSVIGHVGRFATQKNHHFLLKIFKEYLQKNSSAKLLLMGDGDLLDEIVNEVKELGISERVIFGGRKQNVADYLSAMDIFVMPSLFEGLPVVGVEAQANGLPCIMSDEISKEVLLTTNSRLLPLADSAKEWAEVISQTNSERNENAGGELSSKGYNIQVEAKKLMQLYQVLYS